MRGGINNSDVLLCAEGEVLVSSGLDSYLFSESYNSAQIKSVAHFGMINDAYTGVRADLGISVIDGQGSGEASIASKAMFGPYEGPSTENIAYTSLCTDGDILVMDIGEGEIDRTASVIANSFDGISNTADVGICALGDIIVSAGIDREDLGTGHIPVFGMGGTAMIKAEARAYQDDGISEDTSADAQVRVVSHEGGVGVIDVTGYGVGSAEITAEAYGAYSNTASVGVSAESDLAAFPGHDVLVMALGEGSEAYIKTYAHDGFENIADTVVCAPGWVEVYTEDGEARIAAIALDADNAEDNIATTQVYAGDVFVSYDAYIMSHVEGKPSFVGGDSEWRLGDPIPEWEGEGLAALTIDNHENAKDCPDCLPCPDCGDDPPPPPPIYTERGQVPPEEEFGLGGCPALMAWLGAELGIPPEEIQVFIANSFASSTDIQPCDACARLKNAADTLGDTEGTYAAALGQVINEFVTPGAPIAPEQMASIASALASPAEGTQYAAAAQWLDALVQYVAVLTTDMGLSPSDSVEFAGKYVESLGGENANVAAYVQARLAALGG
jgi:hypothetical protein